MKYNTLEILKNAAKAIEDPIQFAQDVNNLSRTKILSNLELEKLNKSVGSYGIENQEYEDFQYDNNSNEIDSNQDNKISNNESADCKEQRIISENSSKTEPKSLESNKEDSLGVMDFITQEITPVRLQQAIILSEIVSKPRCKTRKRRRF